MALNTGDLVSEEKLLTEDENGRKGQNSVFLPHFSNRPVHIQIEIRLVQMVRTF